MTELDTHTWGVRTTTLNALYGGDFHYRGPLPALGGVIEFETVSGIIVGVRVTRIDQNDPAHQIFGTEIS